MRANRRTDTKPELALRRALHSRGYRYRKDYRLDLAGGNRVRPDIAFTARRVAVFVDGCFWHCCPQHGSKPAVNVGYWDPKLRRNVERDRVADTALAAAGWEVVRIWEHEPVADAVAAVLAALARRQTPRVPAVLAHEVPGGPVPAAPGGPVPGVPGGPVPAVPAGPVPGGPAAPVPAVPAGPVPAASLDALAPPAPPKGPASP